MEDVEQWKGIYQIVLSTWDNVVGPKVLATWSLTDLNRINPEICFTDFDEVGTEVEEDDETASAVTLSREDLSCELAEDGISKYIALHTLTGHLIKSDRTDYDTINEMSLSVPALKFVSQTATFYAPFLSEEAFSPEESVTEPSMNSLSVVFDYEDRGVFWNLNPLLTFLLQRIVECLRVGLSQDANYHKEPIVSKWLSDVCKSLSTTVRSAVTFPLSSSISMKQYLSGNEMKIAWDVVITAMLTTSGYCCVVGKQKDYVNNVIDFLMLFLPDKSQVLCSRYTDKDFCCGLNIQGLLEDDQGLRNINSTDILLNKFPIAMLDISNKSNGIIKFSGYVHEHYRRKQRQIRQQELNIMQRKQHDIPFTTENIFRRFGDSSRYVRWCLEQLETHSCEHWSRIISSFHQALAYQAHDIIETFNSKHLQ